MSDRVNLPAAQNDPTPLVRLGRPSHPAPGGRVSSSAAFAKVLDDVLHPSTPAFPNITTGTAPAGDRPAGAVPAPSPDPAARATSPVAAPAIPVHRS